ncbi:MAG: Holliday junction branch migration protein RuvA [Bacteroidia bacterium]|nr:Holliday junction branch migration protein RuvA [Bacteroidia bacterium]
MYEYITGKIVYRSATNAVIDCHGIGYNLNISLNTYSKLREGETQTVFTHLSVKEDSHTLFGFAEEDERRMFRQLITVNGVGASTARMILSSLNPSELQDAIVQGNAPVLQSIKGIGSKSAQRIIIDLKDKILKGEGAQVMVVAGSQSSAKQEALSALMTLGFARHAAEKSLDSVIKSKGTSLSVEELIKSALGNM